MANTINRLSYANTFGEWVLATDSLVKENNIIGAADWTKTSGTLYLNEPTVSLQTNGNIVAQKQLLVQGVGSSATIQNNLTVGGQIYFTNTTLGLTHSGQANIDGLLIAQAPGTSLVVANTAQLRGTVSISGVATVSNNLVVTANTISANVTANTLVTTPKLKVTSVIDANGGIAYVDTLYASNQIITSGNFVINGQTVYGTNTFTISAASGIGIDSYFSVNRGSSGANASIRWYETNKNFQIKNVDSNTYYRILTDEYLNDTLTSTSTTSVATANVANTLNNSIISLTTQLQSLNTIVSGNITQTQAYVDAAFLKANASYARANTSSNTFVGTTGSITPASGSITFASNNGITVVATGPSTFAVSTAQDIRSSASPSFAGLSLTTTPLAYASGGTNATSAGAAFQNLIYGHTGSYGISGYVLTTNGSGTYYWAAGGGGGGGGAVPGTTISSSRASYTANGAVGYTGNSFNVPAATQSTQVRAYINGVRQFESEYNLSLSPSANVISFTTTPVNGDNILIEVDGYYVNPYYANNIAFTVNPTISGTANTIQLAIDGLTSIVALKSGTTFTGDVQGITMANTASNTSFATTAFVKNVLASYPQISNSTNLQINTLGVGTSPDTANTGSIRATGAITAYYSDDNLKTKLGDIENALEKVCSLSGFYYQANETAQELGYKVKREVGVSAQQVQSVLPEVVEPAPISDKYLTVQYERLAPLLIEAIKELKAEIDELKGKIK